MGHPAIDGNFITGSFKCTSGRFNVKWGASSQWSLGPISAWGSKEATTIRRVRRALEIDFG